MSQNTEQSYLDFRRENPDFSKPADSVAIFSGGMDSTVLVYEMLEQGLTPHLLSFNYGQRHSKELEYARKTAELLGLRHDVIDLTGITHLISNSALTSQHGEGPLSSTKIDVPEGHYAEDNMKLTVVPNRNMIMLSIAAGVVVNNSYRLLATGVHAGDHFVYPDCRPRFLSAANAAIVYGNEGFGSIKPQREDGHPDGFIYAPFVNKSKADIALLGMELQVPFENTWSCYKGGEIHCGKCGTCVERLEAIAEATMEYNLEHGVAPSDEHYVTFDRTKYADNQFWKEAIKND